MEENFFVMLSSFNESEALLEGSHKASVDLPVAGSLALLAGFLGGSVPIGFLGAINAVALLG